MEKIEEVVIAGAGIAGLATAVALKRVGIRALVLERSEKLRATGNGILLFPNALIALEALGVAHNLTALYPPKLKSRRIDVVLNTSTEFASPRHRAATIGVHRRVLLEVLAKELAEDAIRFSSKVTSIELQVIEDVPIAAVHIEDGTIIKTKVLLGCDGVNSVVARWLGLSAPVSSGRVAVRGLTMFPQGHGIKQETRQYLGAGTRAGVVPLNDTELHWFFIYKTSTIGEWERVNAERMQKEVAEIHARNHPSSFMEIVRHTDLSTLTWGPLTLSFPWDMIVRNVCKGAVTVAGDAMHPMTPDLGQGGCSALEDAVTLGRLIGESNIRNGNALVAEEAAKAIERYIDERRWRSAWLITASFLSGWMQQHGSLRWMKLVMGYIFYKFLLPRFLKVIEYDCGKLPQLDLSSPVEMENQPD